MRPDVVLIADWSAAGRPTSATRKADSIWIGEAGGGEGHFRTRAAAEAWLVQRLDALAGARVLLGFDFAFAHPLGLSRRITGSEDPRAFWRWLAENLTDGPDNANNRFALAARINRMFPAGPGPFWSRPAGLDLPDLPTRRTGIDYAAHGLTERRRAEAGTTAKPVWMLTNPGAVGSQSLVGQALLHRLSQRPGCAVWPFDPPEIVERAGLILAEVYPSLLGPEVARQQRNGEVRDQAQVRLLARSLAELSHRGQLALLFAAAPAEARQEGWILGAGHAELLQAAAARGVEA